MRCDVDRNAKPEMTIIVGCIECLRTLLKHFGELVALDQSGHALSLYKCVGPHVPQWQLTGHQFRENTCPMVVHV